jgi:hypothetical protein
MHYKFIFVIISCNKLNTNNPYFYSLNKYQLLKSYQKIYLDKFKNDIKFFFIEYKNDITDNIIEIDDFIFIKGNEDPIIPNLLNKTILAIDYVKKKYDFDYILRTNLSSIWNINKLLSLYNEIPRNNFFGGHVNFNSFITGTGIFISRDFIEKLLNINIHNFCVLDDLSISKHMINNGIKMYYFNNMSNYKMNYQILDENVTDINSPYHKNNILEIDDNSYIDDILYFRIRNATIDRDLFITKTIIKKIYNIEL